MKESSTIEREIEVVETLIHQLRKCLVIYYKENMNDEFEMTLKDIKNCETELKKLIAKRNFK